MKVLKFQRPSKRMSPRKKSFTRAEDVIEEVRHSLFAKNTGTKGQNQKELAARCHLSPSTVSNLMSGKTRWPRDTTLFPVLDALGLEMRVVKKGTTE